jgi:alpha-tubulin suppressor-like RCC1 family protein
MATHLQSFAHPFRITLASAIVLLLGLVLASSAAEPPRNNLVVELRQPATAPRITALAVDVRAADIKEPIRAQIRRGKEGLIDAIYIPPGKAREIQVVGLDDKGRVLYQGVSTADIGSKSPVSLVVALSPREGGEPIAVSIATYTIKIEQSSGRKGELKLRASVYDANGNLAHLTPDDYNWGSNGPSPWDSRFQFPHGRDVTIPGSTSPQTMLPLCPFGTTTITICARNVCRPLKICVDPVVAVSAGQAHTCALTDSGSVLCWGDNTDGQLGSAQTTGCGSLTSEPYCTPTPTRITCTAGSPCTFKQISAGQRHTCAVDTNDQLFCWGSNSSQQLGVPAVMGFTATPTRVTTMALAVAAGDGFTCALTHNAGGHRLVECWGANDFGQTMRPLTAPTGEQYPGPTIVRGDVNPIPIPTVVTFMETKLIVAGSHHACYVTTDGWMQCWGDNNVQQVSNTRPITVAPITGSPFPGAFTCGTCTITPVTVAGALHAGGLGSPLDVAGAGGETTCASFTGFDTTCWGSHPVSLPSPIVVKSIDAGADHVCAVTGTNTICWGRGDWGQLGNGTSGNLITPFSMPTPVTVLTPSVFTQVSAGGVHTCAVTTGGTVSCWGRNSEGQLGTGTFGSQVTTPVASLL